MSESPTLSVSFDFDEVYLCQLEKGNHCFLRLTGLELQYVLDAKKDKTKRMFFLKNEGISSRNRTITLRKGNQWRDSFTVYVPGAGIHDKLTTLDVQVS